MSEHEMINPADYVDGQNTDRWLEGQLSKDNAETASSAAPAGSSLPEDDAPVDPGQYVGGAQPSSAAPAASRGASGHWPGSQAFVQSAALGASHSRLREALRRPAGHLLGEPKAAAEAWAAFTSKAEDAEAAYRDVRPAIERAAAERAEALAADAPVALPSVDDARAWAEGKAAQAIRDALGARKAYDQAVAATSGERNAALAKAVPAEAAKVRAKVSDLREQVEALRESVDALLDAAFEAAPAGHGRTRNPSKADLGGLSAIEAEVEELAAAAAQPTALLLQPSMEERELIAQRARQAMGGRTEEMLYLARIEYGEGYAHTSHARGLAGEVEALLAREGAGLR